MAKLTKFSISAFLLLIAILNLAAFGAIAAIGLAKGVTYPTVPHWFAFGSEFCFYAGLILALLSFVGAYFAQKDERAFAAMGVNIVTVLLIAFLTSPG